MQKIKGFQGQHEWLRHWGQGQAPRHLTPGQESHSSASLKSSGIVVVRTRRHMAHKKHSTFPENGSPGPKPVLHISFQDTHPSCKILPCLPAGVVSLLENVFQLLHSSLGKLGAMLEWQPISQASTALDEAVVDRCHYGHLLGGSCCRWNQNYYRQMSSSHLFVFSLLSHSCGFLSKTQLSRHI